MGHACILICLRRWRCYFSDRNRVEKHIFPMCKFVAKPVANFIVSCINILRCSSACKFVVENIFGIRCGEARCLTFGVVGDLLA